MDRSKCAWRVKGSQSYGRELIPPQLTLNWAAPVFNVISQMQTGKIFSKSDV